MAKMLNSAHTLGHGGAKCPCCGVAPNARAKEKAEWKKEIKQETKNS